MKNKYPYISNKCHDFLHGADYNPEQWLETPEIWDEDMRLMNLAHCNSMTLGMFSWVALEPEEGKYDFTWLDEIMDKLAKNNSYAVLATPSGAKPAWLSKKYPEILRVQANRVRDLHGSRHNHCLTSPVYRDKCNLINTKLAQRYKNHPALIVWHISNEFNGDCHCPLCQEAFRNWLKRKYNNDLDKLNHQWWTGFWSHSFTDWGQIESPAPNGESLIHGMNLDWKRFVTDQTIDFMLEEMKPLRSITPEIPITTNLMGLFPGIDYWKMAPHLDVISWDNYPEWHGQRADKDLAARIAMTHDLNRSLKGGQPFMLMESTPSVTNWQKVSKLKKPGMHILSSLQAIAHGSDTVQYFQWRKSRGASEKFHGAVVDHSGHHKTRVFNDVAELGKLLEKIQPVLGSTVHPEVAIIYDWENKWAIEDSQGPRNMGIEYDATVLENYKTFWKKGIPVDIINMDCDFSSYKLLIAPILYMVRAGVAEKIEQFVKNGGCLVTTYWSGIANENDLCFLGGFPGPLRKVTGIWAEEIDALYDDETNTAVFVENQHFKLEEKYKVSTLCELIHAETAQVLAVYDEDFYKGRPVLTVNNFGKGKAYYIASRPELKFNEALYSKICSDIGIGNVINTELPDGITAQIRSNEEKDFIFLLNFNNAEVVVNLDDSEYFDMVRDISISVKTKIAPYGVTILERNKI